MKALICLLLILFMADPLLMAQTLLGQVPDKRGGETIFLKACGVDGDTVRFYRQTVSPLSTPVQVGSTMIRLPGLVQCKEATTTMPFGMQTPYRFFAVPSLRSKNLNSSNGVLVKRKR